MGEQGEDEDIQSLTGRPATCVLFLESTDQTFSHTASASQRAALRHVGEIEILVSHRVYMRHSSPKPPSFWSPKKKKENTKQN